MENNLTVLETKVLAAVDLIKDLRRENEKLSNDNGELLAQQAKTEQQIETQQNEIERLTAELATAREQAGEVDRYEEKRLEIEEKVGGLLAKLEALG